MKATLDNDLKGATHVLEMESRLSGFQAKVDSLSLALSSCSDNQQVKDLVTHLREDIELSKAANEQRSDQLKTNIVSHQMMISERSSESAKSGWVYAGRITEDKSTWMNGGPENVNLDKPAFEIGSQVIFSQTAYLRDTGSDLQQRKAKVQGVISTGARAELKDVKFTHIKAGGWAVWIFVTEVPTGAE